MTSGRPFLAASTRSGPLSFPWERKKGVDGCVKAKAIHSNMGDAGEAEEEHICERKNIKKERK